MGVHISIVDMCDGSDVPGWDWLRHAGDEEVADALHQVGFQMRAFGDPREGLFFSRPDDVSALRAALHARLNFNTERWDQMCDLLAAEENRGLYLSW